MAHGALDDEEVASVPQRFPDVAESLAAPPKVKPAGSELRRSWRSRSSVSSVRRQTRRWWRKGSFTPASASLWQMRLGQLSCLRHGLSLQPHQRGAAPAPGAV